MASIFGHVVLTIIPRARVGYEVMEKVGYNHLICNKHVYNNCFIKNNREMLLDRTGFVFQEQPEAI